MRSTAERAVEWTRSRGCGSTPSAAAGRPTGKDTALHNARPGAAKSYGTTKYKKGVKRHYNRQLVPSECHRPHGPAVLTERQSPSDLAPR